jgi:hypothetical protein
VRPGPLPQPPHKGRGENILDSFRYLWLNAPVPTQPTTPDLTPQTDPHQDRASGSATSPSRTAQLLFLVRKLMDYGFELALTLKRRAAANDVSAMVRPFGTTDIALILARITRGLRLAGVLEERLMRHPVLKENKPTSTSAPSTSAPSRRRPRAARPPARRIADPDTNLANLPTAEQIRRRPVGAVIADICRDLGIHPGHRLWRELSIAIIRHRGSLIRLTTDAYKRLRRLRPRVSAGGDLIWTAAGPQFPPAGGTGPP